MINEEVKEGKRVKYRNKEEIEETKKKRTGKFSNTWFLTGSNTVVLNVPCTPGGALVNKMKEALKTHRGPDGGTTMVVESAGARVSSGLVRNDPFKDKSCPFPKRCMTKEEDDCTNANIVYKIECKLCRPPAASCPPDHQPSQQSQVQGDGIVHHVQPVYIGTSGHNLHKRMHEHAQSVHARNMKSGLSKHHLETHPDVQFSDYGDVNKVFEASSIKSGIIYNTQRYVRESIWIEKLNNDTNFKLMNSRSEWGNNRVRRLVNR